MALRALISVASLKAEVSYVEEPKYAISFSYELATAGVDYELANAANIYIDPDTRNRVLREFIPISEVHAIVTRKSLSDAFSLASDPALHTAKPAADTIGPLLDTFLRVVDYRRQFNDAFTLDDASQIDKDFYGNKGNIFSMLDVMGLTYNKEFTSDSITFGDVALLVMQWKRAFTDSVSFTEITGFDVDKQLNDSITLEDAALIDKDYYGYKGDGVGFSDVQSGAFGKGVADTFSFTEQKAFGTSKELTDTFGFSDIANINKVSGRLLNGTSLNVATIN